MAWFNSSAAILGSVLNGLSIRVARMVHPRPIFFRVAENIIVGTWFLVANLAGRTAVYASFPKKGTQTPSPSPGT